MIPSAAGQNKGVESTVVNLRKQRFAARGGEAAVLADVYREDINIAIWERQISKQLGASVEAILATTPTLEIAVAVAPDDVAERLSGMLGADTHNTLVYDVAQLVDMFCCLVGINQAGLRLTALNEAMCPKFHVDRIPCRLITSYRGPATEWLLHLSVDRSKLGTGSNGKRDSESGLYSDPADIQHLSIGDVAVMKGEQWDGNAGAGLVHRSPAVPVGDTRLLLTLDVVG